MTKLAEDLYRFMHDHELWSRRTTKHEMPLKERTEEVQARYEALAEFVAKMVEGSNVRPVDRPICQLIDYSAFSKYGLYQAGVIDAMRTFAHWHNGKLLVGTSGKTFREAVAEICEEANVNIKDVIS